MDNLKLEVINGEPSPEDKKVMVDGMLAYHKSKGHIRKDEFYSILLKNSDKKVLGTIIVSFRWGGMHIQTLWIDETERSHGWGKKLMQMAEAEAIKKGCTLAYTDTYTWQSPKFYEKLGYELYGKLEDFPKGNSLRYYCKKLSK